MSASIPPPPPPPGPPPPPPPQVPPGPPSGAPDAASRVRGPGIALIVTAVLGGLFALLSVLVQVAGLGMAGLGEFADELGPAGSVGNLAGSAMGVGSALLGLVFAGFVGLAAVEMLKLRRWTFAVVASVIAMIPCISPCCFIGLPVGIWSLVVLSADDVKTAFTS